MLVSLVRLVSEERKSVHGTCASALAKCLKMYIYVFALFIGACLIPPGCSDTPPVFITYNRSEFPLVYPDYPDALVVSAGQNFNLRCEGVMHVNWSFPDYNPDFIDDHEESPMVNISGWQKVDPIYKWAANLFMETAHPQDTGYYTCRDDGGNEARQYVYVRGDSKVMTQLDFHDNVFQHQTLVIPCRPTSPDVIVHLEKDAEILVPGAVQKVGHVQVAYDPTIGFTLRNMNLINAGGYECKGYRLEDRQNDTVFINIQVLPHTDEVPKPAINGSSHMRVVEDQKLVLQCTVTTNADVQFQMRWKIPNDSDLGTSASSRIIDHNTTVQHVNDANHSPKKIGSKLLTINKVKKADTGSYKCIVQDHTWKNSSTTVHVNVSGADETYLSLKVRGNRNTITTNVSGPVQWVVEVEAHPKPTLKWFAPNGDQVVSGTKFEVNTANNGSILQIKDVGIADAGVYKLQAEVAEKVKKILRLTLEFRVAPSISLNIEPDDLFYMHSKTYNLSCEVTAYPRPIIKWYFKRCTNPPNCNSDFLQIIDYIGGETKKNDHTTVSVHYREAKESGYIMCSAENMEGEANQTRTFWVSDVQDGFAISPMRDIVEGDNVTVMCGVSKYNYTNNILWYHRPQPVSPQQLLQTDGSNYILEDKSTEFSYQRLLKLPNISRARGGEYICTVNGTSSGAISKTISVVVDGLRKPTINLSSEPQGNELQVKTSEQAHIKCIVNESARPKPTITWYLGDTEIKAQGTDGDYILDIDKGNQSLTIKFAKASLEGVYRCKAWNRAGEDNKYVTLTLTDKQTPINGVIIGIIVPIAIVLVVVIVVLWLRIQKERKLAKDLKAIGLEQFDKGAMDSINPDLPIDDQAELLPYDRKWEFPRDKLKLGKQLGAGAFGVVMKADAIGICDGEDVTTVAVKMVKRNADSTYIKALASELKIMVHLGKHLNVVNLLGACTKNLTKRELFVIVEYCRFGNLHNYLLRHRSEFIDQVDPNTGVIDPNLGADIIARHESMVNKHRIKYAALSFSRSRSDSASSTDYLSPITSSTAGTVNSETVLISMTPTGGEDGCMMSNNSIQPEWRSNYRGDYKGHVRPICTRDLLCWAFQVARGMEYLAGRKVLHGDLAARNILLSDDNVVKICDFGLAKSMYKSDNYKKKGDGPLPVKWMAVESIRDRVFSTQSDVWSFGIVLWEFFSLARTPYPGMEADEKLYNKLVEGYRMDRPEFATKEVYRVMDKCWRARPTDRPTFGDLSEHLGGMLEDSIRMHYVDLNDPYTDMNTEKWKESQQSDYLAMMTAPTYDNMVSPGPEGEESVHQYANGYLVPRPSTSASASDLENNAGYLCMSPSEKESTIFSPRSSGSTTFDFPSPPQRRKSDGLCKAEELKPMLSPTNEYKIPNIAAPQVNNLNQDTGNSTTRISVNSSDGPTTPNFTPSFSNPSYQTMGPVGIQKPDSYVNLLKQDQVNLTPSGPGNFSSPDYLMMGQPV